MVKEDERGNRPRNGLGTKKKGARAGLESAPLPLEQERHTTCVCGVTRHTIHEYAWSGGGGREDIPAEPHNLRLPSPLASCDAGKG